MSEDKTKEKKEAKVETITEKSDEDKSEIKVEKSEEIKVGNKGGEINKKPEVKTANASEPSIDNI